MTGICYNCFDSVDVVLPLTGLLTASRKMGNPEKRQNKVTAEDVNLIIELAAVNVLKNLLKEFRKAAIDHILH